MARTFNEIQQTILTARDQAASLSALEVLTTAEQDLSGANSTSKVSIWRLWVWIFAFCLWVHEQIVERNALNSRPQNLPNFRQVVLNFLDGLSLVWIDGAFSYDTTGVPDVEARRIIDRCAVLESDDGELVVKIATDAAGVLQPVTPAQEVRVLEYLQQIKVPGVRIRLINETPDLLKMTLTVYVDPLIIDLVDGRLLNTVETIFPVRAAIQSYLGNLEFNGAFVRDHFRAEVKAAVGIGLVVIDSLQWQADAFPFTDMGEWKIPEAGYYAINDADLTINYLPYALVNS